MVKIKPVKRKSLVDTVVERLRALIDEGHLGPGERLPTEAELVKQLEVSRTVLREAVSRLEMLGLVSVQGSRGMFVCQPATLANSLRMMRTALALSPRELVTFTEFRRAIECEAVRKAAERATPNDIAELERLCKEIARAELDPLEAYELDLRFHRRLVSLTGNEVMANVMDVVQEFVLASIVQCAPGRREPEVTYRHHQAIVEAIRSGDPEAAERAMRTHMDSVIGTLQAFRDQAAG